MYRHRSCTNPRPQNGGAGCPGSSSYSASCNTQPCPGNKTRVCRSSIHRLGGIHLRGGGEYLNLLCDGDVPFCPKNGTHNSVNSGGF